MTAAAALSSANLHQRSRDFDHAPVAFLAILPISTALPPRQLSLCSAAHPDERCVGWTVFPHDLLRILDPWRRWDAIRFSISCHLDRTLPLALPAACTDAMPATPVCWKAKRTSTVPL